jgi:integrase
MTNPAANMEHTSPARTRRIANPAGRRFPRPRLERLWGPFEPECLWSEYVPERPAPTGVRGRNSRGRLTEGAPPLFTVAVHTGLRWSEQAALRWRDVDMLNGTLTVGRPKNGDGRVVPLNEVARSVLLDRSLAHAVHGAEIRLIWRRTI